MLTKSQTKKLKQFFCSLRFHSRLYLDEDWGGGNLKCNYCYKRIKIIWRPSTIDKHGKLIEKGGLFVSPEELQELREANTVQK